MTTDQIVLELQRTQRELFLLTGRQGTLFRPPYIEYNDRLVATAKSIGLTTITCSVISGDPDRHIGADRMTRAVLDQAKPGAFIIMHVNGRGWHTAEALPAIIAGLRARGYTFVTVSKALAVGG
jgi:peptidoglycan/xylan/chitin deacetylase (PgdA/CDA1 family)